MKITAVKTFVWEHPLLRGTGGAPAYAYSRSSLLIKLETDAGISGWGETVPFDTAA